MQIRMTTIASAVLFASALVLPAAAQDAGIPTPEMLSEIYTGKVYSPYAQRNFPERPLWGDSHLHTNLSMDAGLFGMGLGRTSIRHRRNCGLLGHPAHRRFRMNISLTPETRPSRHVP